MGAKRMVDIKNILESAEMDEVIRAIEALTSKFSTRSNYQAEHEWPVALALVGKFRADRVLNILLGNEVYYPGYKEVIAAAFGGWLIAPQSVFLREALMKHAAADYMDNAVTLTGNDDLLTLQKDVAARYIFMGAEFLVEIFDCLGGYRSFADMPSLEDMWDGLDKVAKEIITATRAIAYLHHAVNRFGRPGFQFVPSLNKAVSVFDELKQEKRGYPFKEKFVSRSLLHQRWSQNKQTLALLYAASSIKINRKTLLGLLLDGLFSYKDHSRYIQLWIGRARYVSDHIFSKMRDIELERDTRRLLGGEGPVLAFNPPKLDKDEQECFDEIFHKYINRLT